MADTGLSALKSNKRSRSELEEDGGKSAMKEGKPTYHLKRTIANNALKIHRQTMILALNYHLPHRRRSAEFFPTRRSTYPLFPPLSVTPSL
jgi:hypothetical protein